MAELDNLIDPTIDNTLRPYSDSKYEIFMKDLPSDIKAGSPIPDGVTVPEGSNFKKVPTSNEFYEYIKNTLLNKVWNSSYPITIKIPLYIFRYLFNFSYIFAFIGAIFFSVVSILNIDTTTIFLNKNASFIFNIIIGISGLCGMILWLYATMVQSYVNTTLKSLLD